jgi:hypothetical protein
MVLWTPCGGGGGGGGGGPLHLLSKPVAPCLEKVHGLVQGDLVRFLQYTFLSSFKPDVNVLKHMKIYFKAVYSVHFYGELYPIYWTN